MAYAEQLQSYAEMSAIIKAPKSFSSEELNLLQIGATIAAPAIAAVASILVEMWKSRKGYSITIGPETFSCSGFSKEETMELIEKYGPRPLKSEQSEEEQLESALIAFMRKDAVASMKTMKNSQDEFIRGFLAATRLDALGTYISEQSVQLKKCSLMRF